MPLITVFSLEWHINRSDAFRDLLIEPLQPFFDFEQIGWEGSENSLEPVDINFSRYIFCQLPPPQSWLQRIPEKIIWLPMWDNVEYRRQKWWNTLPKALRVVAFSDAVYQRARHAGLKTIHLKYFKNPEAFTPANWSNGRVLLYWNRTGLISPEFLERLCTTLHIDKLLFRSQTDPDVAKSSTFQVPHYLGNTQVETLPVFKNRQEYFDATRDANVFIAPRKSEGVGMAFLEAMARGCAVLALDRGTMNEYIVSGENGYLFKRKWSARRVIHTIQDKLAHQGIGAVPPFVFTLREKDQFWREIEMLNLPSLGAEARRQHQIGYKRWQSQILDYTTFVLDF